MLPAFTIKLAAVSSLVLFQVGASQAATKRLASWVERQMVWNRGTVAVSMSYGCLAELLNLNSEIEKSSSCSSSSSSSRIRMFYTEQNNCTDNRGLSHTERQCTEDEHDYKDDSKLRNLG